mgnify:FL=1
MENTENNRIFPPLYRRLKTEFKDDETWQELCEKTRYVLPNWDVTATPMNIRIWLNRLEIKEVDYREAMQTSIQDMISMNPDWRLRAFVGLLLECKFTSQPQFVPIQTNARL